jgi:hypothetical protein
VLKPKENAIRAIRRYGRCFRDGAARRRDMNSKAITIGDPFPEIEFTDLAGESIQVAGADFHERTLLFVWASW